MTISDALATFPLNTLRDIRVTTHQTRAARVVVLCLAFDHGVETFRLEPEADIDAIVRVILRASQASAAPILAAA